jgi:hypothetical protein
MSGSGYFANARPGRMSARAATGPPQEVEQDELNLYFRPEVVGQRTLSRRYLKFELRTSKSHVFCFKCERILFRFLFEQFALSDKAVIQESAGLELRPKIHPLLAFEIPE